MLGHLNSVNGFSRTLRKPRRSEDREEEASAWLSKPDNGHESESVRPVDSIENVCIQCLRWREQAPLDRGAELLKGRSVGAKGEEGLTRLDSMDGKEAERD